MQVIILEYVVPRVLEYPCVMFDRVSTSKTSLIDILPSGSVLTGHIRSPRTVHSIEYRFLMGSS
jgi:hypothetical protein